MVNKKDQYPEEPNKTHFADPARATVELLEYQIGLAGNHPISNVVMEAFSGIVLILNQHRQAVAVNDFLLRTLGVADPDKILGLRPGEALKCLHAETAPNGCGTGQACITCGAALAILAGMRMNQPIERECHIEGNEEPFEFLVRACPILLEDSEFVVLTLQDITEQKRTQAVERIFLHDLSNCLQGLQILGNLLQTDCDSPTHEELRQLLEIANYTVELVDTHRDLLLMESGKYKPVLKDIKITELLNKIDQVTRFFGGNTDKKQLLIDNCVGDSVIVSDDVLLGRVLVNMLKNALEADNNKETVVLKCTKEEDKIVFSVQNSAEIPGHVAVRMFQQYLSTKQGQGRGLGTYSMKLLGERYLGGKVSFSTSPHGTVFTLSIPQVKV